ncbi:MAG: pyridoxal-phosphate dependent enzyme [Sulfolobales archaeon]
MIKSILEKIDRGFLCISCGYFEKRFWNRYVDRCPVCGGFMIPVVNEIPKPVDQPGVWRWSEGLLTPEIKSKITLFEANTPLIRFDTLGRRYKIKNLLIKDEARNPTGLFMDRGSAVATSVLSSMGVKNITIISTGDLAFSMGVYARRAKMRTFVVLPSNTLPSKILRARIVNSRVTIYDSYESALRISDLYDRYYTRYRKRYFILHSNPYLMNGYQTILFEIINELGSPPNLIVIPFGDGALMTSLVSVVERMNLRIKILGVRASVTSPVFSEIRVEKPLLREQLETMIKDTRHEIIEVSDKLIREALIRASREEGFPIDPIAATGLAGLESYYPHIAGYDTAVIIATAGGMLNDPVIMKSIIGSIKTDEISLGFVKEKILEILIEEGGMPAYRLWKYLKDKYDVRLSLRTIYNHLRELERMGLVTRKSDYDPDEDRMRRFYVASDDAYMRILR